MNNTLFRLSGAAITGVLTLIASSMGTEVRIALSIAVGLPSFVLMIISRRQLGESFAVAPKAKALITSGLYSRIRHPMYLFLDFFLACIIVILHYPLLIIVWSALVIVQVIQSLREERILTTVFGAEYKNYKNCTWI